MQIECSCQRKEKSLQTNISKIQPQKPKKSQKPEPEIKRFKPSQLKSKGSTAMIANGQQQKPKKKENKENKRKREVKVRVRAEVKGIVNQTKCLSFQKVMKMINL